MKRILFSLMLALLMATGIEARTFVLAAGISNYGGRANDLNQTSKDAKRFADLMKSQTNDITLLTSRNVTKNNLLEKLRAISNRAQRGDRIIFFFSGHGSPGSIAGYDKSIPYDEIIDILSKSQASEKVCFIDACFAGSAQDYMDTNWNKAAKATDGMAVFVACRPDEISFEDRHLGAGKFTQALLKGLRGQADADRNKKITIMELFEYIHGDVMKHTVNTPNQQHPQLIAPKSMYDKVIFVWK